MHTDEQSNIPVYIPNAMNIFESASLCTEKSADECFSNICIYFYARWFRPLRLDHSLTWLMIFVMSMWQSWMTT